MRAGARINISSQAAWAILSPPPNCFPRSPAGPGTWPRPEQVRRAAQPCSQGSASRKSGDSDPGSAHELGFPVCEMGTRIRPCPPHSQAAGRPARGQGAAAGYLSGGPAGEGWGPGSRCASSGLRACGSGGAGPWRARRLAAPRLLLGLRGPGTEAGVRGEPGSVLAACPDLVSARPPPAPPGFQGPALQIHWRRFLKPEFTNS